MVLSEDDEKSAIPGQEHEKDKSETKQKDNPKELRKKGRKRKQITDRYIELWLKWGRLRKRQ